MNSVSVQYTNNLVAPIREGDILGSIFLHHGRRQYAVRHRDRQPGRRGDQARVRAGRDRALGDTMDFSLVWILLGLFGLMLLLIMILRIQHGIRRRRRYRELRRRQQMAYTRYRNYRDFIEDGRRKCGGRLPIQKVSWASIVPGDLKRRERCFHSQFEHWRNAISQHTARKRAWAFQACAGSFLRIKKSGRFFDAKTTARARRSFVMINY